MRIPVLKIIGGTGCGILSLLSCNRTEPTANPLLTIELFLNTSNSILSVFTCGLCPFFVVDRVRFLLWIVSIFTCGSCPFLPVDHVHFTCGQCPFLSVDHVRFYLWIMSAFTCGSCPHLLEEIQSTALKAPSATRVRRHGPKVL